MIPHLRKATVADVCISRHSATAFPTPETTPDAGLFPLVPVVHNPYYFYEVLV
jgi:hypothetical protein